MSAGCLAQPPQSAAITAAITRAAPNYMPLARQANAQAIEYGYTAIPDGPYKKKAAPKQ